MIGAARWELKVPPLRASARFALRRTPVGMTMLVASVELRAVTAVLIYPN